MATLFKNKVVKEIGTLPVDIYETDASTRATVIGLSITNLTTSFVYVDVIIFDDKGNGTSILDDMMKKGYSDAESAKDSTFKTTLEKIINYIHIELGKTNIFISSQSRYFIYGF